MGTEYKFGKDWAPVTVADLNDFAAQVDFNSEKEAEFLRKATLPAATERGAGLSIGQVANGDNLPGTGNLYCRAYGGSTTESTIVVLP